MREKQFLPSKEDIENEEAKELSKRLIGNSHKETLTNIMEWQERNIQYWYERADMFIILVFLSLVPFILVYFLPTLFIFKIFFALYALFSGLLIILDYFMLSLIFILLITSETISIFALLYAGNIFTVFAILTLSIPFGGIISLLLYLILKYRHIKAIQPKFKLKETFASTLSVGKILKYRLAVCRDYAKICATLLIHSYPKNRIFFITLPQHVAAAINLKDRIYVLDQKLPVLTLEKWMLLWNKKTSKNILFKIQSSILRIIRKGEVQIYEVFLDGNVKIKKICNKKLEGGKVPKIDTKYIVKKLENDLRIGQISENNVLTAIIPLKNFALCYDRDEIVEYSLIKAIKNKLENEFCGNLDKITGIEIKQNNEDLILECTFPNSCVTKTVGETKR